MHHEAYMQRCFQLAEMGLGNVAPNPLVGAVVVYNNEVIGEGYHQYYGGPHAEVNALRNLEGDERLKESTLYVNLEPCAHFGKTPPCADLILRLGLPRVVVANRDPFHLVNGAGLDRLVKHGVEVVSGVMENEGRQLNKRFFTFHEKKRPFIILKWAQSKDGFIDKIRNGNLASINWITNSASRRLVHQWRSDEMAILVGANTIINDNPSLTVREVHGKSPIRLVIGDGARLPKNATVYTDDFPTLVFHTGNESLQSTSSTEYIPVSYANAIHDMMEVLYKKGIQSVIVEGGAAVLTSFISSQLWDEARVFTGEVNFESGLKAPILPVQPVSSSFISSDELRIYNNRL